jgi:hypothetical protein
MRDDRRLNALARGRLRAQRGAAPRLGDPDELRREPAPGSAGRVAGAIDAGEETHREQRFVAIFASVLR